MQTPTNKHDHSKCNHNLKYCEHCDIVYCTKCSEEWKKNYNSFTYTSPGTSISPQYYCNGDAGITLCASTGTVHIHNP